MRAERSLISRRASRDTGAFVLVVAGRANGATQRRTRSLARARGQRDPRPSALLVVHGFVQGTPSTHREMRMVSLYVMRAVRHLTPCAGLARIGVVAPAAHGAANGAIAQKKTLRARHQVLTAPRHCAVHAVRAGVRDILDRHSKMKMASMSVLHVRRRSTPFLV